MSRRMYRVFLALCLIGPTWLIADPLTKTENKDCLYEFRLLSSWSYPEKVKGYHALARKSINNTQANCLVGHHLNGDHFLKRRAAWKLLIRHREDPRISITASILELTKNTNPGTSEKLYGLLPTRVLKAEFARLYKRKTDLYRPRWVAAALALAPRPSTQNYLRRVMIQKLERKKEWCSHAADVLIRMKPSAQSARAAEKALLTRGDCGDGDGPISTLSEVLGRQVPYSNRAILRMLKHRDDYLRRMAAHAMTFMKPQDARRGMKDLLKSEKSDDLGWSRRFAIEIIGNLGPAGLRYSDSLLKWLKPPGRNAEVLQALMLTGYHVKYPEKFRTLLAGARGSSLNANISAAGAYVTLREYAKALPIIRELFRVRASYARRSAAKLIQRMKVEGAPATPGLLRALYLVGVDRYSSPGHRVVFIRALGAIGPGAKIAIPHLILLLQSREHETAFAAWKALFRIDPKWYLMK